MRRFREAMQRQLGQVAEVARTDIPAGEIRDQLRGGSAGVLPPTGNTGTGYTPGDASVTTDKIDNGAVTLAKLQTITTDRLLGRDTASTGNVEELTVSGGLEFTGSGGIQRSALTGDVTASAGSGSTTIANDAVTYAKMQNISAASKLLGRGDSGSGDPQEISLGSGLSMSGTTLSASGGGGSSLTVEEVDGSPTDSAVTKLIFPNGTLSITSHEATYTPAAGYSDPLTTRGDLVVRGAASTTRLALGASGKLLTSDGTDAVWGNGPLTTRGDIITAGASGAIQRLGLGSSGQVLISDGTDVVWGTPGAGSGGAMSLISEQLLGSDTATITFSSIPGTYRHLKLICYGRTTDAAPDDYIYIRFNNDSGSNYDEQRVNIVNAEQSIGALYALTKGRLSEWPGAGSSSSTQVGGTEILIPHYAGTTFDKMATSTGGATYDTTGNNISQAMFHIHWRSTAAITRIDILPASNNFKTGSIFSLYGIN